MVYDFVISKYIAFHKFCNVLSWETTTGFKQHWDFHFTGRAAICKEMVSTLGQAVY